jgi:type II secretory pathway predicted ATPase ExeA
VEIFHFTSPPFTREVRIDHRLSLPAIDAEIKALREVVEARQSAALVAPAGCGKTVVLRALKESLPAARYSVYYFKLSNLSARDMCKQVALALGLAPQGQFPALAMALEERFRQGYEDQGLRQVLVFDDAQDMRLEAIRLLRLLTNFEMDSRLVVSIILSGQLSLKQHILTPELEDVRQRLAYCGELRLLSREDTLAYLDHRTKIAGLAVSPFSDAAKEALFEITRGNMRALDKLALASLKKVAQIRRNKVEAADVAVVRGEQWM